MEFRWRFLWFTLILFSLLYQGIYFGMFPAIKTSIGVSLGVLVVWIICTTGKRLKHDKHTHWLILHVMGYYYTSGAKGFVRQLFDLFVWYFGLGLLLNYPLATESVEFSISVFVFVAGLIGITIPWVRMKCNDVTHP